MRRHRVGHVPEGRKIEMSPAVILCGGLGTRLRGTLGDKPKCLAPIGNSTFLELFTNYLHRQSIENFIFATGYGHAHVNKWLESTQRPWRWAVSQEHEPLGTGGALRLAAHQLTGDCFLAFNGDTLIGLDCGSLLKRHAGSGAPLTLAAVQVPNTEAFGRLEVVNGYVVAFQEKGIHGPGLISGGAYAINREFITSQPEGYLSLERDVLMRPGFRPAVLFTRAEFLDIGTPESLAKATSWATNFPSYPIHL
jgi:D-glycero-alpha-D-manno-heptose 1-phosphate guanylyltransferase